MALWLVTAMLVMFIFPPLAMEYSADVFESGYEFLGNLEDWQTVNMGLLAAQMLGVSCIGAFLIVAFREPPG